jgi:hypothetical protein
MAEEIIFKVGVDTGDSVQDVNKVGDAIEGVDKEAKKTSGSFVNLKKELRQLTIQLQGLDPASKEFEQVAKRAGSIKEQLRGVADAINDADPEKFGGKFQRTAEGIAGAFSAVTGAQALFGKNSEEIEKQMLKVQGAIALTQGISAMKELKNDSLELANSIKGKVLGAFASLTTAEIANAQATGTMTGLQKAYAFAVGTSTGAMKAFRLALVATGIGALIVLIGFLVEKMMSYASSTAQAEKAQNKLNAEIDRQNAAFDRQRTRLTDAINFQVEYAQAIGKSEKEILKIKQKGIDDEDNIRKQQIKKNQEYLEKLSLLRGEAIANEDFEVAKNYGEKIKALEKNNQDLLYQKTTLRQQEVLLDVNFNKEQKEKQDKANEDAKKKRDEEYKRQLEEIRANNLKKIELENARILEQENLENEYYDSLKTQQDLEVQAVRDKYNKIIETTTDNEVLLLARQKELDAVNLKYKEEADKLESERLNNIANQYEEFVTQYTEATNTAQQNEKNAVDEKYNYLIEKAKEYGFSTIELERKRAEELKAIDTTLLDAKKKFVDEISNLLGALANSAKQGSAVQKAFAVAQVAVDTAKSISSVIAGATAAAAAGGPAAPFLIGGYIASGLASVTKAFSSVNQILKQPLPSVNPPSMNRNDNNFNANGTQQNTQQVQAQSTYKVVVVDSDITNMQNKTKKVQAISTI